jgi:hypothetical protein
LVPKKGLEPAEDPKPLMSSVYVFKPLIRSHLLTSTTPAGASGFQSPATALPVQNCKNVKKVCQAKDCLCTQEISLGRLGGTRQIAHRPRVGSPPECGHLHLGASDF